MKNPIIISIILLVLTETHPVNCSFETLDLLFENYKESVLSDDNREIFEDAVRISEQEYPRDRQKRDMPTMYMGKKKKLRTCANMNGILGGSNAFNTISFILAILTLVVNTNNNINNNNNNLNQANLNTASNNNANANSNNNNANVINVMPPGKKKRRKRRSSKSSPPPSPFDVYEEKICVRNQASSVSGELSLAAMFLIQSYFKSRHQSPSEKCQHRRMCQSLREAESLGLGGRLLTVGVRAASEVGLALGLSCEAGHDDIEDVCQEPQEDVSTDHHIQCSRCGHHIANSSQIINIESDHAFSTGTHPLL